MSKYKYILISFFVISFLIGLLLFVIHRQNEINNRQLAIESSIVEQKELSNNILRGQATYASKKDIEKFIKDQGFSLNEIKSDLNKLQAGIVATSRTSVVSTGTFYKNVPSTALGKINESYEPPKCEDGTLCLNTDKHGYFLSQQKVDVSERFKDINIPIGTIGFSAWEKNPWEVEIKSRKYSLSSVLGRDENERIYLYSNFSIEIDGEEHTVPISSSEIKQEFPEANFSFFNPRLFLGADAGINLSSITGEFSPSLNIAIMSYGRFKKSPDISILQVGAGIGVASQKFEVNISPVLYNIGKHIPLMNNFYVGPSMHINTDADVSVMMASRVAL